MSKKILVLVLVLLLASPAFATMVATRVSGSTVTFSTVISGGNNVVTFNSVTKHIRMVNLSTTKDCYADLRCVDANGNTGYFSRLSATVLLPAIGKASPNTVEFDFATKNLGFASDATGSLADKIDYVVTGETGDL